MNKTVLISGATSGIGKACAHIFAKNGYNLIITGRRADRLEELKNALQSDNCHVTTCCFDIRNAEEVNNAIATLPTTTPIDILINNAGLALGLGAIQNGSLEHWDTMIDTNVKGLLYLSKAVAPRMIAENKGHIINIGSIAGKEVYANGNVYCATKHAVDALTKAMRIDMLAHHIKVTAIHPGMVETEFSMVRFEGDESKAKAVYAGINPLSGEDIANTVYYCATLPSHVCINELTIMPTVQASATNIIRQ